MRTPATAALDALGIAYRQRPFESAVDGDYGLAAAAALGEHVDRVLKTLVVTVAGGFATAVVPVSGELDLRAVATALGGKHAAMADRAAAARRTGYVVGGISPFGQRTRGPAVVDESALAHATVLVSGGRRGLDLELAPVDLVRATGAVIARIRR